MTINPNNIPSKLGNLTGRILGHAIAIPADIIKTVFESVDDLLENYGDRKMDEYFDKAKTAAMTNKEYASIEKKRKIEDSDNIILANDELTFKHWDTQDKIMKEITPPPAAMPVYRFLKTRPIRRGLLNIKYAYQRLTRSWDDTATWSLDTHLCLTLGQQLKHLAKTTHGWPQSDKYPTFEQWQEALNHHGDQLIAYGQKWDDDSDPLDKENKKFKAAQTSLRWVAANLGGLWD